MVTGLTEYDFQTNCVEELIRCSSKADSKQVITVKAPTGAGKTVSVFTADFSGLL